MSDEVRARIVALLSAVPVMTKLTTHQPNWSEQMSDYKYEEDWKLTANELYDRIHNHPVAKTEDLLAAAEVAKFLIYNADCIADEQDDEEFFGEALTEWPAVVEAVIEDCELDGRDDAGERLPRKNL